MDEISELPKWRQAYAEKHRNLVLTNELVLAGMKYKERYFMTINDNQMKALGFRPSNKRKTKRAELLIGKKVTIEQYSEYIKLNDQRVKERLQEEVAKEKRRQRKKKAKAAKNNWTSNSQDFYASPEWRNVRYGIIEKHKGKCCACGQSYKEHGVVMHVDHIKPRSKYPELELDPNNLQLLCEICNLGKMADYQTDWR